MRIQSLILGFKRLKIILISQACHNMREETPFSLSLFFLHFSSGGSQTRNEATFGSYAIGHPARSACSKTLRKVRNNNWANANFFEMFHFHKCPNHQTTTTKKTTTYPSRNCLVHTHVIWGSCVEHVKVSSEIVVMDPDPYHDVVGCNWLKKCSYSHLRQITREQSYMPIH